MHHLSAKISAALAIAGILVLSPAVSAAAADLTHTTAYRTHRVAGTTPAELYRAMKADPIIDPDDGPALANLTHDHDLVVKLGPQGSACRVADLSFRWRFVLTLPEATQAARMSAANRALWTGFVRELKRHEETHRAIFLDCGQDFVAAARRLTGPCGGLERKVRAFVDARYAACMKKQRVFEAKDRPRILASPFLKAALRR